jgi:hypothetical protein
MELTASLGAAGAEGFSAGTEVVVPLPDGRGSVGGAIGRSGVDLCSLRGLRNFLERAKRCMVPDGAETVGGWNLRRVRWRQVPKGSRSEPRWWFHSMTVAARLGVAIGRIDNSRRPLRIFCGGIRKPVTWKAGRCFYSQRYFCRNSTTSPKHQYASVVFPQ